jgi:hypothetical protein
MIVRLMWKEGREHVGKMLGLLGVLGAVMFISDQLTSQGSGFGPWAIATWAGPIWMATFTITGERTRRTTAILDALPVRRLTVFSIKTAMGFLTFFLPLGLLLWLDKSGLHPLDRFAFFTFWIASATSYVLLLSVGMQIRREGLAAMVGVVTLLMCGVWLAVVGAIYDFRSPSDGLLLLNPFELVYWMMETRGSVPVGSDFAWMMAPQIMVTGMYWAIAAWRYRGQLAPAARAERRIPATTAFRSVPLGEAVALRSPLFWKERREQLAVLGGTAITGVVLAFLFALLQRQNAGYSSEPGWGYLHDLLGFFYVMGTTVPVVVAAILGISAIVGDLDSGLAMFWRSRPISIGRVFWTKYFFALLGVGLLTAFFEVPFEFLRPVLEAQHPHAGYMRLEASGMGTLVGEFVTLPLVLSLACLSTVLVRRGIYAVVLVVVASGLLLFFPIHGAHGPVAVGDILYSNNLPQLFLPVVGVMVCLSVGFAVAARVVFERRVG